MIAGASGEILHQVPSTSEEYNAIVVISALMRMIEDPDLTAVRSY